jgi:cytochrome c oxidase cbb3-type subunit 3
MVAIGLVVCTVVGVNVSNAHMRDLLLRTPGDEVPNHPRLVRLAETLAAPAYAERCAACHGATMQGDPSRGVPNLVDRDWLYGSGLVSEIEQTITYGIRSGNPKTRSLAVMPSFLHQQSARYKINTLSPPEMSDLAQFLFEVENRPFDRAAAARGADLYSNKGACYDCHTADARGDQAIGAPNLADNIWLYGHGSREDILRAMIYGHAGVCPAFIHRLPPVVIRALAVSIHDRATAAGRVQSPS